MAETLAARDFDALMDYRERAPGVQYALPSQEHFTPLFIAAGAAADEPGPMDTTITGWWFGQSKRSIQFN